MVLAREAEWVWDSWYVVDGDDLHAFYLMAPKSLGMSELRHVNARVGHSISRDGISWTHLPEAFGPSTGAGFDSLATWTGSIVREGDTWHMFYTGISQSTRGKVQCVGHATSADLTMWTRVSERPVLRADERYDLLGNPHDGAEHFRDPWVFWHSGQWHMLVTASDPDGWGTVAHATSTDLDFWRLRDPLFLDSRIKQFEVTQAVQVNGHWGLVFCANPSDFDRPGVAKSYGTFWIPADGPIGPLHLDRISVIADDTYAGRVVEFNGEHVLLGFRGDGTEAGFSGTIGDPIRLQMTNEGVLQRA